MKTLQFYILIIVLGSLVKAQEVPELFKVDYGYKIKLKNENQQNTNERLDSLLNQFKKNERKSAKAVINNLINSMSDSINFTLTIYENHSKFEISEHQGSKESLLYTKQKLKSNYLNFFLDKRIVQTTSPQVKHNYHTKSWLITDSVKVIKGYQCKIAYKKSDTKGNDLACFTPKLPYPTGPENYGGLPGLIIYLEKNNGTEVYEIKKLKSLVKRKITSTD